MESSLGFMAVFAVSGSVVFLATQFHKRLLSDYMDKFDFEIRTSEFLLDPFFFFFVFGQNWLWKLKKDGEKLFFFFFCDRSAEKCGDEEEGEIRGGCGGAVGE